MSHALNKRGNVEMSFFVFLCRACVKNLYRGSWFTVWTTQQLHTRCRCVWHLTPLQFLCFGKWFLAECTSQLWRQKSNKSELSRRLPVVLLTFSAGDLSRPCCQTAASLPHWREAFEVVWISGRENPMWRTWMRLPGKRCLGCFVSLLFPAPDLDKWLKME